MHPTRLRTILTTLLTTLLITGCQAADSLPGKNDPKGQWWELGFIAPSYMQGEVEYSTVVDTQGKIFNRTGGGAVGSGDPGMATEAAKGWSAVGGSGKPVVGADLPKRIFVRWQSVVEPQTYRAWIDIPDEARQLMRSSTEHRCAETPEQTASFTASMYVGLAPGGIVQIWVRDECRRPINVARSKGEIEPLGPHLGQADGHYYPQSEKSKRYVEKYGVPYGSW
ncbi:DUF2931 family protein [Pseudomonas frederiksbergensis]|uniref:DUF2931 family protein n=1 Tax=Pseudomonas frederiksbergensis TaxID=104087 RepID=UPI000F46749A|nr:DUF2931 family protein [Pseudomonas frederiksbergensis]RON48933.1 hypothetical protein BK667_20825 [Pseudomonas frederiksbergensis]